MSANIFNDSSRNWYVYASNLQSPTGNVSVSGNLVIAQITGTGTNINNTLTFTGNLAIPLGITSAGLGPGQIRYNTSISAIQFYNGNTWVSLSTTAQQLNFSSPSNTSVATTFVDSANNTGYVNAVSGGYTIYTITYTGGGFGNSSGTISFSPTFNGTINYLIVGGGGPGGGGPAGTSVGGGGGAGGGFICSYGFTSVPGGPQLQSALSVTSGTSYPASVGQGGLGVTSPSTGTPTSGGGSSSLNTSIVAAGGGAGGQRFTPGGSGGSGGGGGGDTGGGAGPASPAGQGFAGGAGGGTGGYYTGGGGGGAAAIGTSGTPSVAGNGGSGILTTIVGAPGAYYAGGGGGGVYNAPAGTNGTGGNGGGGAGGTPIASPASGTGNVGTAGTANTGGGGGGSSSSPSGNIIGSNGGSGVVILRISSFSGY
jgi:hypothetical protein